MSNLNSLRTDLETKIKATGVGCRGVIVSAAAELFAAVPAIRGLRWTQFSIFWDNGRTSGFGVGDARYLIEGLDDDGFCLTPEIPGLTREGLKTIRRWERRHGRVSEAYKLAFGDYVQVTVHRDGTVEIDTYDHE